MVLKTTYFARLYIYNKTLEYNHNSVETLNTEYCFAHLKKMNLSSIWGKKTFYFIWYISIILTVIYLLIY